MKKSINEIIKENTALFQEVIKEKLTEDKTPAIIIFISADNKIETFHREGTDAKMLRSFLQSAMEWADRLDAGEVGDDYFPENFKSKD